MKSAWAILNLLNQAGLANPVPFPVRSFARVEAPMLDFGTDGKKEKRRGKRKTPAGTAAARLGR